jgi:phage terminase large subunit
VIDEAGSVPQAVAVTAQAALATGRQCKLVIAGNPTSLDGPLYGAAVTHRHHWHVVSITGDPDDPRRSTRVSLAWARDQIAAYGRDNPWVKVNVLGQFPPQSLNALIGVDDVQAAMARALRPAAYEWAQKRIGVDVARFGDDRTVLFPRQGLASFHPVVMRHSRGSAVSVDIATRVLRAKAKWGSELEIFDSTGGWAAGAVDVLRASGHAPLEVQFAAAGMDARYRNRRAELWFTMVEWIRRGGQLPNVPELVGELTAPTYAFVGGRFALEDKEQVKQRLGRSPDLADALALTFGLPDMPAAEAAFGWNGTGKVLTDFDPFDVRYLEDGS